MTKLIASTLVLMMLATPILSATPYRLTPGDTLQIEVRNRTELNSKQSITPDGTLSLPLISRIKAQGLTLYDLDTLLKTEYTKYLQQPIIVTYLTPKPIYIVQHNLSTNTYQTLTAETADQAKAMAGPNVSPTANFEPGSTILVTTGEKAGWFEKNWYKVITATAIVTGFVIARK